MPAEHWRSCINQFGPHISTASLLWDFTYYIDSHAESESKDKGHAEDAEAKPEEDLSKAAPLMKYALCYIALHLLDCSEVQLPKRMGNNGL